MKPIGAAAEHLSNLSFIVTDSSAEPLKVFNVIIPDR